MTEEELFQKYPEFFADKDKPMTETCMCWGIECGPGWYSIIDEVCAFLKDVGKRWTICDYRVEGSLEEGTYNEVDAEPEAKDRWFRFSQIKEKYGTLRIYYNTNSKTYDKFAYAIVAWAEWKSEKTCENCGKEGKINAGSWYRVRCRNCWEENYEYDTILLR